MSQQGRLIDLPSSLETLTGNSGGAVPPDGAGNINVVGSAPIDVSGNPGTNTLTIDTDGTLAITYTEDSGTATPSSDNLNINGDTEITQTTGSGDTITIALTDNAATTAVHGWNGSILETAAVTVTSDGATITCSVEQSGGGDLTVDFSDGFYAWDTTPADTVTLTAGTDTSPQLNYVYFLQSTKTLMASTTGFPSAEHAPICTTICQSAASLQTDGPYKLHAWTDHVVGTDDQGHISHLNYWIRQQNATYQSGVAQTYTITPNGGAPDNVLITTTAGVVLQLHPHAFPAFGGTPDYYVINDFTTPYTVVTDLNALLTDSQGVSMSGRYFSLVLWGVVSEDTGDCKLFINLPSGSYNNQTSLEEDADKFANYTIPTAYRGTGFLISEWKLRHQAAASGTWTSIDTIDLRGLVPSLSPGGTVTTPSEFADNAFRIFDDGDPTKEIAFEASAITSSNTRTITMLDADIDLADVVQGASSVTDNALARYDTTTGKLLQDSTVLVSDNGEMTNTSQPSFLAYINTTESNQTGDGTAYLLGDTDVGSALSEVFDQNGDFTTGSSAGAFFTAPVTGKYYVQNTLSFSGIGAGHTRGISDNIASNRTIRNFDVDFAACAGSANTLSLAGGAYVDMDAGDTLFLNVQVSGSTKTVDLNGISGAFYLNVWSATLIC